MKYPTRFLPAFALIALAGMLFPLESHARGRSKTVHGPNGGVHHREISRVPGQRSASAATTLPDGRTAGRSVSTQRTETGRHTTAQATGFNGRTLSYDGTVTRTETGRTRTATYTGPNGGTRTKDVNVTASKP